MIILVMKETLEWMKKRNFLGGSIPPWILTCVVIVFTRMRKRTRNFIKKTSSINTILLVFLASTVIAFSFDYSHTLFLSVFDTYSDDFVDVLLDLEKKNMLSDSDMIAEMIFRGTDTVAILLEWILARMVLHPDIQAKVQFELDTMVGTNKIVTDSDLPNLPYLLAIVKETLRTSPQASRITGPALPTKPSSYSSTMAPLTF
ncbi:cytochrome P450 78A6-like [Olea europaea var. sylvestris]|uniref:cytochrome P450 78A6-like n=1 Tax=Olea europaea var. sylvestris TaxID=158386 RepID=UPI000C1D296E|nr:cytochrome P450 78A6-like [Olea europaea var. sylvestris]